LRILYLVHDLTDPAVARRAAMLEAGGASVVLAGFRRSEQAVGVVDGRGAIDLGRTSDGRFAARVLSIAGAALTLRKALRPVDEPDVIIARNLEMLALGARARRVFGGRPALVYEMLDVHRLLLREDALGQTLRRLEGALASRADLLITSSPAFVREYFSPKARFSIPMLIVENKVFDPNGALPPASSRACGGPWRIGWFGMIRCRRSFDLLAGLAARGVEVVIRGRPSPREFPDFAALVARHPNMSFLGAYRYPDDLPAIYGEVDFAWAIDFFEEGENSSWLLPNRLYESARFGAVPIALSEVETGRYLAERGVGLLVGSPVEESLPALIAAVDDASMQEMKARIDGLPRASLVATGEECRQLVRRLQDIQAA
jgi:succinoglycan biosynthesis protein ExoL